MFSASTPTRPPNASVTLPPPPLSTSSKLNLTAMLEKLERAESNKLTKTSRKRKPASSVAGTKAAVTKKPRSSRKSVAKRPQKPSSTLNPQTKNVPPPTMQEWIRLLGAETRTFVGIDMSLTNPGLCILNPVLKTIHLFCFRNRRKERSAMTLVNCRDSVFYGWLLQLTLLEEWPEDAGHFSLFRFNRYEVRLQLLMGIIGMRSTRRGNQIVGIEHYSFKSSSPFATAADTTLKELGGCLRRSLCQMGHNIMEIPPTTIKKVFTHGGGAKKTDMYMAYAQRYFMPSLYRLINIEEDPDAKVIPHPIEDVVDALAVAMTTLVLANP